MITVTAIHPIHVAYDGLEYLPSLVYNDDKNAQNDDNHDNHDNHDDDDDRWNPSTTTTTTTSNRNNSNDVTIVLGVDPSRVMWYGLKPCIFDSTNKVATIAVQIIMESFITWMEQDYTTVPASKSRSSTTSNNCCIPQIQKATTDTQPHDHEHTMQQKQISSSSSSSNKNCMENNNNDNNKNNSSSSIPVDTSKIKPVTKDNSKLCTRKIKIHPFWKKSSIHYHHHHHHHQNNTKTITLWIHPIQYTSIEYTWEGLLVHWENRLIQAQSFAGYLATLGGGFFLCHHFQSAYILAAQQKRLAIVLSDESMYYKCFLNQVYNFIYSGKFTSATKLLHNLLNEIRSNPKYNTTSDSTLMKMCLSAKLFNQRMRKAYRKIYNPLDCSKNYISKTVDDYQRIRVIHADKSKVEDLTQPF